MTRTKFIQKWLGNPEKPYTEQFRDEMRDDLDKICESQLRVLKGKVLRVSNVAADLKQVNKELKEALKRIADNDIGCWSNEGGIDSCDTMQTIAIHALKTKSK